MSYSETQYAQEEYAYGSPSAAASYWDLSFAGYSFTSSNVCGYVQWARKGIGLAVSDFPVPRDHGTTHESTFFRRGEFGIVFTIIGTSRSDFETKVDAMFKQIHGVKDFVRIKKASGEIRQIEAVCEVTAANEEHYNITWDTFTATFNTVGDFWHSNVNQSKVLNMTSNTTDTVLNGGNAISRPETYFIYNTASSVTEVKFIVNNIACTYTWTASAGDVFIFDCINKVLTKNGTEVAYTWTIQLELAQWANTVQYQSNGTFDIDIVTIYRKNYKNG